ncbi:MAG: nucleoside-diphosphate kinase [Candidatus Eremiobacteraeota bacterium]|nr:nucleoside-diphosphate kinase [Candidatus Eremiobacteraeota bacterium]
MERTLILVKPDGVQRALVGEIIARFERRGLQIVALKFVSMSNALAEEHYQEHVGKPFFRGLVDYITSCPIVAMVVEGPKAIEVCRATIGATDPLAATPGSIRGDYGATVARNLVHGSDGPQAAAREIDLFFNTSELHGYERSLTRWITE